LAPRIAAQVRATIRSNRAGSIARQSRSWMSITNKPASLRCNRNFFRSAAITHLPLQTA
jgi:hypothetical protein